MKAHNLIKHIASTSWIITHSERNRIIQRPTIFIVGCAAAELTERTIVADFVSFFWILF